MEVFNPFTLQEKVIVVTGASSGIGQECAIACSRMGATVLLMARNVDRLMETVSRMDRPDDHSVIVVDLTDFDDVAEKVKAMTIAGLKISGIVHCAGISTTLPFRMTTHENIDRFFQTNIEAAILLTRLLTKPSYLSDKGASVIFLTSVMGIVGEVGKTIYSLTKGALIAGSKSLALELAPKKIRVNCISPGVVETPMSSNAVYSQDEASLERIRSYHPLGLGRVDDIANACVYLLSDAARWITGTNLIVDGGYTAK